jgi:hypothetical protein
MAMPEEISPRELEAVLALVRRTALQGLTPDESMALHRALRGRPWCLQVDQVYPGMDYARDGTAGALSVPHVLAVRARLFKLAGVTDPLGETNE